MFQNSLTQFLLSGILMGSAAATVSYSSEQSILVTVISYSIGGSIGLLITALGK